MRLLFIRHGEPDYSIDSLTETGRREADALAAQIRQMHPGEIYVSPLGRARDTAAPSLRVTQQPERILDWLEEFPVRLELDQVSPELGNAFSPSAMSHDNDNRRHVPWDMYPSFYIAHPEYYMAQTGNWRKSEVAEVTDFEKVYDYVTGSFDAFLAERGYVKDGIYYRAEKANEETYTFFCHFGITCVFLSRLWNVSPFFLWHTLVTAPTSVTEVVTEEREKGIAIFRTLRIGDVSHLHAAGMEPSFAARFCETYDNMSQRH